MRKTSSITLCIAMLITIFAAIPPIVSASTNGHSQDDAVRWITDRETEGWAKDYDHTGGLPQCVDLIKYYLVYLDAGGLAGGNAYAYADKNVSAYGWTYTSTPSPGDIAVWKAYKGIAYGNGHVALVKSVNGSSFNYVDVNGETGLPGKGSLSISNPSTFIHPDFTNTSQSNAAQVYPEEGTYIIYSALDNIPCLRDDVTKMARPHITKRG